jgi:molybdopterin-guanine dinucleotide biosynthesis adapter protein
MKIFSIVGWSGSGKTTLITRLIENFKAKRRRVVAVKSTHAGYSLQPEGKDTARFLAAGADEAYLMAAGELLRMTRLGSAHDLLAELEAQLGPDDIVLLEGFSAAGIPVIEVEDPQREKAMKFPPEKLAAVISRAGDSCQRPCFLPADIAAISAFMEAYHGK